MPIIKRLPDQLINQIAAGEVVERPASAVKELVENSLDAGAGRIVVEISGSGQSFIRITDDGCGMDKEDAVMIFERHATSKIFTPDDLFDIRSFGFRGEAVASIASVSKVSLRTRKSHAVEGTHVYFEGGKKIYAKPVGTPEGTQIEVRDLFYNTPARKKYLKSDATEYLHILNTVTALALAHYQTAFRLVHDGKTIFDLPPASDAIERINSLMGHDIATNLVPVFYGHSKIRIEGFVGKPQIARANRNNQYLFVNGRDIKSNSLAFAVRQSFFSLLPKEKYPVFFLYLNVDPGFVDVNVHPRKTEVRFNDEKEIFRAILKSCEAALQKHVLSPQIDSESGGGYSLRSHQQLFKLSDGAVDETERQAVLSKNFKAADIGDFHGFAKEKEIETQPEVASYGILSRESETEMVPVGQIGNSYILCQQGEALVIVDQHAAHERIRYTALCEQFEQKIKSAQPLLVPLQMEFSHKDAQVLSENRELLNEMGFEIEHFGGNTYSILCVPSYIVNDDIQKVIIGLIDDINDQAAKGDYQKRKERALVYMACRSAVKFGDRLSIEEQKALMKKLQQIAMPYTCPHGRPTMITMSFDELERRFKRKGG